MREVVGPIPTRPIMQGQLELEEPRRWVVHARKERYDVYVGRGKCPRTGQPGEWGNPFAHVDSDLAQWKVRTPQEAVDRHAAWVRSQPDLVERIKKELRGRVLGCWCRRPPCHGHTLARIANE